MLHDPGSNSPPQRFTEISLAPAEKEVLRRLGGEIAAVAALPVHREKAGLWRKLNDLESARPMVWINEIPWHEMNVNDELTLRTVHPWARELETRLRRTLYQWRHMPCDMIVSDFLECPLAVHSTDFGIHEEVEVARTDASSDIVSRHFRVQIREPADIEKIRMPRVSHDQQTTAAAFATMEDLYRDIMPVRKVGQTHIWFTPWDYLIRWWGLEEAMVDLVERPEMVNAAVERMVDAWMVELDQFVEQNLLSLDCNNTRIGSGGYGYTWELPGATYDPARVTPKNMWGCSNAQIFSECVSRHALGVRHPPRPAVAGALGPHLLRLLRAPGQQAAPPAQDPEPPQDLRVPLERLREGRRRDSRGLRVQLQAQPGHLCRGAMECREGPGIHEGRPGQGPGGLPRGDDHEGRVHRVLQAAEPVGLGADRDGAGRRVRVTADRQKERQ